VFDTSTLSIPDVHDYDAAWGSTLSRVVLDNGTALNIVVGHDKMGHVLAMDAQTGEPLWWIQTGVVKNSNSTPSVEGSGETWPGTQNGVESYAAVDNDTLYIAISNGAFNFVLNRTDMRTGVVEPVFSSIIMENGIGNGSIIAIYLQNGTVKWEHPTEFPTWVSPLVTNGVVFSGHVTSAGHQYEFNTFGAPTIAPRVPRGILLALDSETGEELWSYATEAPIGIGGPSIAHGMLLVTTGIPAEVPAYQAGFVYGFGLRENSTIINFPRNLSEIMQFQGQEGGH